MLSQDESSVTPIGEKEKNPFTSGIKIFKVVTICLLGGSIALIPFANDKEQSS